MRIQFQQETGPPGCQPQDTRSGGGKAHEISLLFGHQEQYCVLEVGREGVKTSRTVGFGKQMPSQAGAATEPGNSPRHSPKSWQ